MAKHSGGDDEFLAAAQLSVRQQTAPEKPGMVMTKLDNKPSKSLAEILGTGETQPVASVPGHTIIEVAVLLIDPNPQAPRTLYTPEMILARADDLRLQGQHDPIHVIPNPQAPGRYIIADGWTRVQACIQHKVLETLRAEVHEDLSIEDAAWFGYQQNECRQQHCDLDRGVFYATKIAAGEPAVQVAERAGISKTQMTKYLAYTRLPEEVLDIVRQAPDRFGANATYLIHQVCSEVGVRKAVQLAMRFLDENMSFRALATAVQTALHPPVKAPVVPSRKEVFANGFFQEKDAEISLAVTIEDPEKRRAFAVAVEALLNPVAVRSTPSEEV